MDQRSFFQGYSSIGIVGAIIVALQLCGARGFLMTGSIHYLFSMYAFSGQLAGIGPFEVIHQRPFSSTALFSSSPLLTGNSSSEPP